MRTSFFTSVLIAVALNAPSVAQSDGAALYLDNCSACHGEAAEGSPNLQAPVLAGYSGAYLSRQMAHFQSGARTGLDELGMIEGMVDILGDLSSADQTEITEYLAALDVPQLAQEVGMTGFRDRGLYSGCSSCHEASGNGNEALGAPRLTGQYDWYLAAQLQGFRAGHRGTYADDKFGKQMKVMADAIASDEDIETLTNYILTLDAK